MRGTALLFPGQGVQYMGMGKQLYESFSLVKNIFHQASDCLGFDLKELCFEGNKEKLSLTEYTQPAVLTVSYAAARVLMEEYDIIPDMAAGHSLGEITALTAAGGLEFKDAVKFVRTRGKLMQEAAAGIAGAMTAVMGIEAYTVNQVCREISREGFIVEVSNYNSPQQTVISGNNEAVAAVEENLKRLKAKTVRLSVSAPFHCSLMKPALMQLDKKLQEISFGRLKFPVLSNVTGAPYVDEQKIKTLLLLQITHPVEWTKIIDFMRFWGITEFIDAGPGDTVKNMVRANVYGISAVAFDKGDELPLKIK